MTWEIVYTKQALKDAKKLAAAGLRAKAKELLEIIRENPFRIPRPFINLSEIWPGLIPAASPFNIAWFIRSWMQKEW